MIHKTKLELEQVVWMMMDNEPQQFIVQQIKVVISGSDDIVEYYKLYNDSLSGNFFNGEYIFDSKLKLMNHVFDINPDAPF